MKKYLFIGCGGSGGMTLRYLMDQASADLASRGAGAQLPLCWQFLHIDAPALEEDKGEGGFRTVTEYNEGTRVVGHYCSIGSSQNFENVAKGVLQRLNDASVEFPPDRNPALNYASWLPKSRDYMQQLNSTPLLEGAGQFRMMGRTLFLNSLSSVIDKISEVKGILTSPDNEDIRRVTDAIPELGDASQGGDSSGESINVFIIGSMAGGSGASMLLDVTRAVHCAFTGADNAEVVLYGYAPEIFKNIPGGVTPGHIANSLAMGAEITSMLSKPDSKANLIDADIFRALGRASDTSQVPFKRFFPIGLSQGVNESVAVQDARPETIYRRLGRGLARMVVSNTAINNFNRYTLGNTMNDSSGAVSTRPRIINWGIYPSSVTSWAGFGYASLSMGRDRFKEYAAQRLARVCVDRLYQGYMDPQSTEPASIQLKTKVDTNLSYFRNRLCLPDMTAVPAGSDTNLFIGQWLDTQYTEGALGDNTSFTNVVETRLAESKNQLQSFFRTYPTGNDSTSIWDDWLMDYQNNMAVRQNNIRALEGSMSPIIRTFVRDRLELQARGILAETRKAIAQYGLEFAAGLLDRIRAEQLPLLQQALGRVAEYPVYLENVGEEVIKGINQQFFGGKKPPKMAAGLSAQVNQALKWEIDNKFKMWVITRLASFMQAAYADMDVKFIQQLVNQINNDQKIIAARRAEDPESTGVEMFATDSYAQWPKDEDVPSRFEVAHNEVVVTDISCFPSTYQLLLTQDEQTAAGSWQASESMVVQKIVTGDWPTVRGVESPQGLLEMIQNWRAENLRDPGEEPHAGRFELGVTPTAVVERARLYLERTDEAFDRYIKQSFNTYLMDPALQGTLELEERQRTIASKFMETLSMAKPMVAVDANIAASLHTGVTHIVRNFSFSNIPFASQEAGTQILNFLRQQEQTDLSPDTVAAFSRQAEANKPNDLVTRVDIFGTYQNYSPVTFSSMYRPIFQYWNSSTVDRGKMTTGRRTRSLPGYIPASDADRKAMIGGWLLGRVLNMVFVPKVGESRGPAVYDTVQKQMIPFPWPMYSRPERFQRSYVNDDWMPAVLESLPLANLDWYSRAGQVTTDEKQSPTRPYQMLREIFNSAESPEDNIEPAAQKYLTELFRTGKTPVGDPLLGTVISATTPDERCKAFVEYITSLEEYYTEKFLTRGVEFQDWSNFEKVYDMPKIADLAGDTVEVCGLLKQYATVALAQSQQTASSATTPGANSALPVSSGPAL